MPMIRPIRPSWTSATVAVLSTFVAFVECRAAELHVGGATVSITPDRPVALAGQMHTRIARTVESPVTATALALEFRDGDKVVDQAVLVSCDLVAIDAAVLDRVRQSGQGPHPRPGSPESACSMPRTRTRRPS